MNNYIKVKFDDGNGWVNNELIQKVLLQVSAHELHIDMSKDILPDFPWHTMKKDTSLLVILLFNYFLHPNYKNEVA